MLACTVATKSNANLLHIWVSNGREALAAHKDFIEAVGGDTDRTVFVAGVRTWF